MCSRACTPAPMTASVCASGRASASVAAADAAAVRMAVIVVPSITAMGSPVSGLMTNTVAMMRGRPRRGLSPMTETIFTASESVSLETTCAGMTSVVPRPPASSRWLRSGMSASPAEMARNARFIASTAAGIGSVWRTWLALRMSIG